MNVPGVRMREAEQERERPQREICVPRKAQDAGPAPARASGETTVGQGCGIRMPSECACDRQNDAGKDGHELSALRGKSNKQKTAARLFRSGFMKRRSPRQPA
jgi:hypothetical protein